MLPLDLEDARKYISTLENDLAARFKERNRLVDRQRDAYFLDHFKNRSKKAGETFITVNKPTNIVNLGVGILSSNPMRIRAYRVIQSPEDQKTASMVEKYLRATLYINNERQETDIELNTLTDQLSTGWACLRSTWDADAQVVRENEMDPMDAGSFEDFPVVLELIPIKNVYWEEGGPRGRYRSIIYTCDKTAQEVEDEWNVKLEKVRDKRNSKVKYIDYWGWTKVEPEPEVIPGQPMEDDLGFPVLGEDGEQAIGEDQVIPAKPQWVIENAIIAGDEWVKEPEIMYGYEDLPFTIIQGCPTTSEKPEHQSLSLLFPNLDQFDDLERQLSHYRRLTDLYTSLPPVLTLRGGEEPPALDAVIGNVVPLREGEKFEFPNWPGTPPDLKANILYTQKQIEEGSFPASAYGEGDSSSGFAVSLNSENGRIRLHTFQKSLERGWAIVFRKILSLATYFAPNQQIPCYGRDGGKTFALPIVGGMMKGFRVDVEIKPKFPQDESRKSALAVQAKAQDIFPLDEIWERYYDVDYPDEMREKWLYEKFLTHPDVMKAKIMDYLRRVAPDEVALMEGIAQQGPSQGPPQGPPRAPETQQQNVQAQGAALRPPDVNQMPEMPPAAVMPQEMAGIMPPQAMGGPPPGQEIPPELRIMMNAMNRA